MAWNCDRKVKSTSSTTGPILLGNSSGVIIETQLGTEFDRFFQGTVVQYWKEVPIKINNFTICSSAIYFYKFNLVI